MNLGPEKLGVIRPPDEQQQAPADFRAGARGLGAMPDALDGVADAEELVGEAHHVPDVLVAPVETPGHG